MATDDVLDPTVVAGLRRAQDAYANPGFIRQLAALFEANTPGKMHQIRHAIAARDATAIVQAAHTLGTNCGMLGATRMAAACARMEDAARRAGTDAAAFAQAEAAFREAEAQLPAVLSALSALEQ